MEQDTPPVNLKEALGATESHLERMQKRVEAARDALQDGAEEEAWSNFREVVDDTGDMLGLVINDIQDLAPAEYFPNGMESILGVAEYPPEVEAPPEVEDRIAREFDPHDHETRENLRLAIRAASNGGNLDAVRLGLNFAPPENLMEEFASEDDLREGMNRALWDGCEGMTPGEIEQELQAAERAVDNAASKVIDYVLGRVDAAPPVTILWASAWRTEVLNEAVEVATLPGEELPSWEELTGEQKDRLRKWPDSPAELSRGAQDVLRGILWWIDGRPKHLWPDHKETLCGYAGEEVDRKGWGEDHPERPLNTLEGNLRQKGYSIPKDVEELVELARSTLSER
jgi:hypothetical protein